MLEQGFTKCPVCNNNAKWEEYSSSWGTEEEYITCPVCNYRYQFAYGNYFEEVGNKWFVWDYTMNHKTHPKLFNKMNKAMFMARIIILGENQWMIDPDTLCEFTGHRDSHKQNIYQNDIVAFWIGNKISCKELIWYCNEINCMTAVPLDGIETNGWDYYNNKYPNYDYQTFCLRLQDPWGDYSKIEVIGNIFDNPELLVVK